MTSNVI